MLSSKYNTQHTHTYKYQFPIQIVCDKIHYLIDYSLKSYNTQDSTYNEVLTSSVEKLAFSLNINNIFCDVYIFHVLNKLSNF